MSKWRNKTPRGMSSVARRYWHAVLLPDPHDIRNIGRVDHEQGRGGANFTDPYSLRTLRGHWDRAGSLLALQFGAWGIPYATQEGPTR